MSKFASLFSFSLPLFFVKETQSKITQDAIASDHAEEDGKILPDLGVLETEETQLFLAGDVVLAVGAVGDEGGVGIVAAGAGGREGAVADALEALAFVKVVQLVPHEDAEPPVKDAPVLEPLKVDGHVVVVHIESSKQQHQHDDQGREDLRH